MNKIDNSGTGIATLGRDEDAYMAHVAAGEMVVPPVISPETRARLFQEMQQVGLDPNEYTVGEGMSINPITGMPEFGFLKKVFKSVKKVAKVAAPLLIPGIGGPLSSALGGIGGAIGTGIKTLIPGSAGIVNALGNVGSSILGGAETFRQGITSLGGGLFGGPMNTPGINPAANYTTVQGDTLSQIAARNNLTLAQLKAANPQLAGVFANPETLQIGETVNIPGATTFRDPVTGQIVNTTSGIGNFLGGIFGGGQNQGGGFGGGLGTLANLAIARNIIGQGPDNSAANLIPTGVESFGYTPEMIAALSNKDYGIGNLQPALIQGQQYANLNPQNMLMGTPIATAEAGGIMGLEAGTKVNPDRMDDDGPGDITPAFLEPGEFVITRPATRVLGARNLYKLMKEAEKVA
tara:strand:- start:3318 stop:4538 length:1221 start_codon:yes stop_codon:yes gene_type:complete